MKDSNNKLLDKYLWVMIWGAIWDALWAPFEFLWIDSFERSDKKYHGKIFGKFEQVENTYSGKYPSTGLGLTITKELIEMHNGKIWLESRINNGTTFIFELPFD